METDKQEAINLNYTSTGLKVILKLDANATMLFFPKKIFSCSIAGDQLAKVLDYNIVYSQEQKQFLTN